MGMLIQYLTRSLTTSSNKQRKQTVQEYRVDSTECDHLDIHISRQQNISFPPVRKQCNKQPLSYSSLQNGVYDLQENPSAEIYPVYCHMTYIPECGAGGWTLVMKTNGDMVGQNIVFTMFVSLRNQPRQYFMWEETRVPVGKPRLSAER